MMIRNALIAALLLAALAEKRKFCKRWRTSEGKIKSSPRYWYPEEQRGWDVFFGKVLDDRDQMFIAFKNMQGFYLNGIFDIVPAANACVSNGAALKWIRDDSLISEVVKVHSMRDTGVDRMIWTNVYSTSRWLAEIIRARMTESQGPEYTFRGFKGERSSYFNSTLSTCSKVHSYCCLGIRISKGSYSYEAFPNCWYRKSDAEHLAYCERKHK
ncbi:hypothetical protein Q1695_014343 [Nippostrongylus brasiliensis]|nr:hypothetical protein Q1695_014343 [Nippostrongylus brasiliensis]